MGSCPTPQIFRKYSHFVLREGFSKQNVAIRLKSNILAPQNFWAGYATVSVSLLRDCSVPGPVHARKKTHACKAQFWSFLMVV